MKKKRKFFLLIGAAGLLIFILLALISFMASRYVSSDAAKKAIRKVAEEDLGSEVTLGGARLVLLPRPGVAVQKVRFTLPGGGHGTVGSLNVYPQIFPLLEGKVALAVVEIASLNIRMPLPEKRHKEKTREKGRKKGIKQEKKSAFEDVGGAVALLLKEVGSKAPGLTLEVKESTIILTKNGKSAVSIKKLNGSVRTSGEEISLTLEGETNRAEKVKGSLRLRGKDLIGEGMFTFSRLKPGPLFSLLSFSLPSLEFESPVDLNLRYMKEREGPYIGEVEGSVPMVTLIRKGKREKISLSHFKGSVEVGEDATTFFVSDIDLSRPSLKISGKGVLPRKEGKRVVEISGKDIDATALRKVSLSFLGDVPTVRDIFGIIRGGKVPRIEIHTEGAALADLGKTENLSITGRVEEGSIFIPGVNLKLGGVEGDVEFSRGILKGSKMKGAYKKAKVKGGTLLIGLQGKDRPFHLAIDLAAPVKEIQPLLLRFVGKGSFRRELKSLQKLDGQVRGTLVLGEKLSRIAATVDVREVNISGRYPRFPYPISLREGRFRYSPGKVEVEGITLKGGNTLIKNVTGKATFGKVPMISSSAGAASINIKEVRKWLLTMKGTKKLLIPYGKVGGRVNLSSLSLKGPLLSPSRWKYHLAGSVEKVVSHPAIFPGELTLTKGSFKARPGLITLKNMKARLLDSSMSLTGSIKEEKRGGTLVDLDLAGTMGKKGVSLIGSTLSFPRSLLLRAPMDIRHGHVSLGKREGVSFSGDFILKSGPRLKVKFRQKEGFVSLDRLEVVDGNARGEGEFRWGKEKVAFAFKGNLPGKSLRRLFEERRDSSGGIRGDIRLDADKTKSEGLKVRGKVEGNNLHFPLKSGVPFEIESLSMRGEKGGLRIDPAILILDKKRIELSGMVVPGKGGIRVELTSTTDKIDWNVLEKLLGGEGEKKEEKKGGTSGKKGPGLTIEGKLQVKAGEFTYSRFTFRPFHAEVSFRENFLGVTVQDASLCGISSKGTFTAATLTRSLDFHLRGDKGDLGKSWNCIVGGKEVITGSFEFKGDINGKGKEKNIFKVMKGTIDFSAKNGRIYEGGTIAKVISLINVTEVFRGTLPDFMEKGFAYKALIIKGDIGGGKFHVTEAHLNGKTLEMVGEGNIDLVDQKIDMELLVSPLKTVDSVIKVIPLVNYILGGNLVSLPVKVKGDLSNPKVTFLSPGSVGSGLLRTMGRVLKAPVKVIEPIIPSKKENPGK